MKTTYHHFIDAYGVRHDYVKIFKANGSITIGETIPLASYLASKQGLHPML